MPQNGGNSFFRGFCIGAAGILLYFEEPPINTSFHLTLHL